MPIYFRWFTKALLSVGGDASDQNLPQSGRLLYCVINGFLDTYSLDRAFRGDQKLSRILFRDQDLFLAQKIEVGLTARARIDDGGKVARKIVCVAIVSQGKCKGDLQCDLGRPDDFAVSPRLTVNRDITARSNCIQE